MDFDPSDFASLSDSDLRLASRERLARMDQIRTAAGGSLDNISTDQQRQVRRLNAELRELASRIDASPHPRGYTPPATVVNGHGNGGGPGWRPGHWSGPFLRQLGVDQAELAGGEFMPAVQASLTPSGSVTVPALSDGIVPIEDRPQRLIDVIPRGGTLSDTDQYAYLREIARVHAAAETAPGALKPTSTYSVEKVEDRARVIAHVSEPIDRFAIEDTALLAQYIDGSLRIGVLLRLDAQIINGGGLGENLTGLASTSGIQVQPFATDMLTTARKALTLLEDVEIPIGIYVLSTAMWEALELLTLGDDQHYALGEGAPLPVDRAQRRLWGQPVIVTSALTGANAYLVDFAGSTRLYERNAVRVDWSEAPEGSVAGEAAFKSNELVFRGEGRFGFAVLRPDGIVQFDTTAA